MAKENGAPAKKRGGGRERKATVIGLENRSHSVTAEVEVPASGAEGVIVAQGGITGGWSLYAKDGRLKYCYNFYGLTRYYVEGEGRIPAGRRQARMEFARDGGDLARGATVTLFVDGKKVGEGRVEQTEPTDFSADETCDVGYEAGSLVTPDYKTRKFSGEVNWVEIDLCKKLTGADRTTKTEERSRVVAAAQ
jgi:arylsulfatase